MSLNSITLFLSILVIVIFLFAIVPGLETIRRNVELTVSGILRVPGVAPEVMEIYVNNSRCEESPPGPTMNGLAGSTVSLFFNATLYDQNGDCNTADVIAYVCKNETGFPCNAATADASIVMTFYSQFDTYYCNFTTLPSTYSLDYYKRYGYWYVNVTATQPDLANSTLRFWNYGMMPAVAYPLGDGMIDLGTISLDVWNYGRGANTTRNIGNVRLNLTWNATDFTCPLCSPPPPNMIEITGDNFAIANISGNPFDNPANYRYINDNPLTQVEFFPTGGMRRCGIFDCSQDEHGNPYPNNLANYTLWWEINTSSPKQPGIYNNSIQVTGRYHLEG
ncbi:MAG: hypothetical protein QMD36_05065 [Candidatus Aenigmarchaeota archaeon]|nr:hypothetical protein [Candidatus Aenigmarchaeota archaeon]